MSPCVSVPRSQVDFFGFPAVQTQLPGTAADTHRTMSHPRQVLPNRSYMITRRCTQRQFLLRPDAALNNAFIYCLPEAAQVHRIDVLSVITMSNHVHLGVHDAEGNYPLFIEPLHKHLDKCVNSLRWRWENMFWSEQASVVRLTNPNDVIDKMACAHANPCATDLVECASQWPGVSSVDAIVRGHGLTASRPAHAFRAEGPKRFSGWQENRAISVAH